MAARRVRGEAGAIGLSEGGQDPPPTGRSEEFYRRRMSPDFRRFLPLVLVVVFAALIVPTLLHRSKSGLRASDKTTRTIDAIRLIDSGEQDYKTGHGRYTQHLADLVSANPKLAGDLAIGIDVRLDVSTDGDSYLAQVASDVLSLVRARTGTKLTAHNCVVLKNSSGVHCPP
jgi:hypothetical protein